MKAKYPLEQAQFRFYAKENKGTGYMKSLALVFAVQGGLEALPGMAALGMSFGDNPAGQFAHRLTMWSDYIRAIRSASSKPSKP